MKIRLSVLALLLFPLFISAQKLESAQVLFFIDNAGFTVEGSFDKQPTLQYEFKGKKYEKMKISGTLDVASINTGIGIRDNHLRNKDYFYVTKFPTISLASSEIKKTDPSTYKGTFQLTIKGISQPITMLIEVSEKDGKTELKGTFTINRLDFGLGEDSIILSDNVKVEVIALFK